MTRAAKVEFLRAKAGLIIAQAAHEQGRQTLLALFSWTRSEPSGLPPEAIRRGDQLLQEFFDAFNPDVRKRMDEALLTQFGITRLSKPPKSADAVVERVFRRGSIPNDDAARLVGEVVADTSNIESLGPEAYRTLATILDGYRSEISRRPPEKRPNKAPEPTTTSVTPPAAQESRQP